MPLFLVIWPDLQDYCQNEPTSEKLIRASVRSTENFLKTFIVDSDVYFYFGIECNNQLADNIWEVYALSATSDIIVQKLTPDKRKYEAMYEGILGRVRRRMNLHQSAIRAIASVCIVSIIDCIEPNLWGLQLFTRWNVMLSTIRRKIPAASWKHPQQEFSIPWKLWMELHTSSSESFNKPWILREFMCASFSTLSSSLYCKRGDWLNEKSGELFPRLDGNTRSKEIVLKDSFERF